MSMRPFIPTLLGCDWWESWKFPERIMDQCFGMQLLQDDLLPQTNHKGFLIYPRTLANIAASGQSEVKNDMKQFQVTLDMKQFKPEEMEVRVGDNYVLVHGKHEEKSDEDGFVSREFTRKYMLPNTCEPDTVTSSLTPDGVLIILAPKKVQEYSEQERPIPISIEKSQSDK